MTTSGVNEPQAESAAGQTVDDDDSFRIVVEHLDSSLRDDEVDGRATSDPGQSKKLDDAEREHFSSAVGRSFGESAASMTAASKDATSSAAHQVGTSDPADRAHLRQSVTDNVPTPTARGSQPPRATTLHSTPRVTLGNEQSMLADRSTARFQLNVEPTTGSHQAEDSQLNNESTPGRHNTLPGAPIAIQRTRAQQAAEFLSDEKTPSGGIRRTTGLHDFGPDSTLRSPPRQTDEYDVQEADLRRAQGIEAQAALRRSRATTPPRPLPAIPPDGQRALQPTVIDQVTVPLSATESAWILEGFERAAQKLAPSELRRALGVRGEEVPSKGEADSQHSDTPRSMPPTAEANTPGVAPLQSENSPRRTLALGDLGGPLAQVVAQTRNADQSFVASEAARLRGGGTRDMSAEAERLSSIDFDATPVPQPTEPLAAPTPPTELDSAARATVRLDEAPRVAREYPSQQALLQPERNTLTGRASLSDPNVAPGASGAQIVRQSGPLAAVVSKTTQSEPQQTPLNTDTSTGTGEPAEQPPAAPTEAERAAEQWAMTPTLDVGAVQARRFLEAFARNQVNKEHDPAPSGSFSLPGLSAAPNEHSPLPPNSDPGQPTPDSNHVSTPNTDESSALSTRGEDPGAPSLYWRSKKIVKRPRDQRASGPTPVVPGRPRSATGAFGSIEDMLRNYLDDE